MSEKNTELKLLITEDILPKELKHLSEPLETKLENISSTIYKTLNVKNITDFSLIVVKAMESVEEIRHLTSSDKHKIVTRCIVQIIQNDKKLSIDTKIDYIISIPGLIESVIQLTKGETLNRNTKNVDIADISYITNRALSRICLFIKQKKYNLNSVLKNIFLIVTQTMYIVGSYPSLSGEEKKEIVINVITQIINTYKEENTSNKIPDHFIEMTIQSLPMVIDTLVNISNNDFNINNSVTILSFLKNCCICPDNT